MKFRTAIEITPEGAGIGYGGRGLLTGSCFTENIGRKMKELMMPVTVNPMGILFNPASIADTLGILAEGRVMDESDLVQSGDIWVNFAFHGSFSSVDRPSALERMNRSVAAGSEALREAEYIILTFGTAWVYEREGKVVSNCHKLPASEFVRRYMDADEIVERLSPLMEGCLAGKKVILTVSPVRHIGDGMAENSLSKATLIVAAAKLQAKYASVFYFPAYEIMMDDLRDYRFYERDMVHPSQLAIDYIWEQFCRYAVAEEARAVFSEIGALRDAASHRPVNPLGEAHRKFLEKMREKAKEFGKAHPDIDISEFVDKFREGLEHSEKDSDQFGKGLNQFQKEFDE